MLTELTVFASTVRKPAVRAFADQPLVNLVGGCCEELAKHREIIPMPNALTQARRRPSVSVRFRHLVSCVR